MALTSAGQVLAWGADQDGELGNGRTVSSDVPVRVRLPRHTKITAVRAGCRFSLALTSTGRLLAWGANQDGELGNGTTIPRHMPVQVRLPGHTKVTAISIGCYHVLALTTTGKVLAWGLGYAGELGDGSDANRSAPAWVMLPRRAAITAVSAGCYHSLALSVGGRVLTWGANADGELGNGNLTDSAMPGWITVPPPAGKITALAAGGLHNLALASNGTLLAWGFNANGQLGNGRTSDADTPVVVTLPGHPKIKMIRANVFSSFALTTAGQVLAWGWNLTGQLGDGNTTSSAVPVMVRLPAGYTAVSIYTGSSASATFALMRKRI